MTEWKLVPVEIDGGHVTRAAQLLGRWHGSLLECHRAILAAAPEPPADERDAEIVRLREAFYFAWYMRPFCGKQWDGETDPLPLVLRLMDEEKALREESGDA